jgi:hypothetical protein
MSPRGGASRFRPPLWLSSLPPLLWVLASYPIDLLN